MVLWIDPEHPWSILAEEDVMITDAYKYNFRTLLRACGSGDLALVDAKRVSDGKSVALVVAVGFDGQEYHITPLAVMCEGNPYEDYLPPSADGGYCVPEDARDIK